MLALLRLSKIEQEGALRKFQRAATPGEFVEAQTLYNAMQRIIDTIVSPPRAAAFTKEM